ncbi:LuxR C-terminal-related transcriptional regulator [Nocardia otitidiscaviarum]|uniref:LuxR C-terminal-related transcriptional regulator n=1 Tax=Nocardia otitidiscaviarum TaxID=1823 RepID=UPI000B1AB096
MRLTPHELSIAQLAVQVLTNREIGQRLYLSHRTVSPTCTGSSRSSASIRGAT